MIDGVRESGERLVFGVQSRTNQSTWYRVDLEVYECNGQCNCANFGFKHKPHLDNGAFPDEKFECWHIKRAKRWLIERILPDLAKELRRKK